MSWGHAETSHEKLISALLMPIAAGFRLGLLARLMAYNAGFLTQKKFDVPVISIGNITVGGTGKTPVTIDIARRLTKQGHKVGILSRGYKRQSKEPIVVVSNGAGQIQSCNASGDEPYLIAKAVPQAVVIVGSKRINTAEVAINKYGCDVLLLDDGFQHWPIARTTDIVLVDYNDEPAQDRLIPAGRLREPLAALARAQWVVVTKVPESPDLDKLARLQATIARYAPKAQVTSCRMAPYAVQCIGSGDSILSTNSLNGMRVVAFSGIARPEVFAAQLSELGASVVGNISFGDHHWYTPEDIERVRQEYARTNAQLIVTTEKDAVKLQTKMIRDLPFAALQQQVEWLGPVPSSALQIITRSEKNLVTS
jgi:tetraacyldisaccharide 4'-kinase